MVSEKAVKIKTLPNNQILTTLPTRASVAQWIGQVASLIPA